MDLLSEIDTLKADALAAQGLLSDAQASIADFTAKLADKDAAIAKAEADLAAAQANFDAKVAELATKEAALADALAEVAKLQASAKTAEELATEELAKVGAKPMTVSAETIAATDAVTTREQALAAYASAKGGTAKAAIYKQHKNLILGK